MTCSEENESTVNIYNFFDSPFMLTIDPQETCNTNKADQTKQNRKSDISLVVEVGRAI